MFKLFYNLSPFQTYLQIYLEHIFKEKSLTWSRRAYGAPVNFTHEVLEQGFLALVINNNHSIAATPQQPEQFKARYYLYFCRQWCNRHNHTAGAHEPAAYVYYNACHTVKYELFHCRKWIITITGVQIHDKSNTKIQCFASSIVGRTSMLHYAGSGSVHSKEGWNWNLHYQYPGPADAKYLHQSSHVQLSLSPDGWGGSYVSGGGHYGSATATAY